MHINLHSIKVFQGAFLDLVECDQVQRKLHLLHIQNKSAVMATFSYMTYIWLKPTILEAMTYRSHKNLLF